MERINRWLPVASLVVGAVLVASIMLVGYWSQTSANNSAEVRRGTQIAACRSTSLAEAMEASSALDRAKAALDMVIAEGLHAFSQGDDVRMGEVIALVPAAEARVVEASVVAEQSFAAYSSAAEAAAADPEGFLSKCQS